MLPNRTVIGAGPAGLVAAATLARAGGRVRVYEKAPTVGHRFAGDFQGLENWSSVTDALDRLAGLGVEPTFAHRPFHQVTFYDSKLHPVVADSPEPLFYLVQRGSGPGSLDRGLLDQAERAGAEVLLGRAGESARRGDIVAVGPHYADGIATGYVFATSLEDQAHCIISEELAPAGYAYLLIWEGRATVATCLFRHQQHWKQARQRTVEAFSRLVPGLDFGEVQPFSGYGSMFGAPRYSDEAGRLYVGEAAGLQDPEWGFGMWYAMESGALAARSLLEGFDYPTAARTLFENKREAAFFNRLLYEALPDPLIGSLLRGGAASTNLRRRVHRHWKPHRIKTIAARAALPRFTRNRLVHRDRACHAPTCDCVWCTCGPSNPNPPTHRVDPGV